MNPTVSVVIPSYNHENFIQECIQSVLNQTFQDFEIVITDDGSSDNTIAKIQEFSDKRIKLFKFPINSGASIAANNSILNSSGKYIAMLNSDDVWFPDKLAIQVDYLEKNQNIAAVFGKANFINNANRKLTKFSLYKDVFNVANRTRQEWLRFFFLTGNCLCHPCSLVRRDAYFDVGLLNPAFSGLPDFDLWVRLCLKYDIHVLDQELINFRILNETMNASGDNINNRIRNKFEYKQILNNFLSIKKPEELRLIFPEAIKYGEISSELIPYFLGRIAIQSGIDFKLLWGLEVIYSLLQNKETSHQLKLNSNFTFVDFYKLTLQSDVFKTSIFPVNSVFNQFEISTRNSLANSFIKYLKDIYLIMLTFLYLTRNFIRKLFFV